MVSITAGSTLLERRDIASAQSRMRSSADINCAVGGGGDSAWPGCHCSSHWLNASSSATSSLCSVSSDSSVRSVSSAQSSPSSISLRSTSCWATTAALCRDQKARVVEQRPAAYRLGSSAPRSARPLPARPGSPSNAPADSPRRAPPRCRSFCLQRLPAPPVALEFLQVGTGAVQAAQRFVAQRLPRIDQRQAGLRQKQQQLAVQAGLPQLPVLQERLAGGANENGPRPVAPAQWIASPAASGQRAHRFRPVRCRRPAACSATAESGPPARRGDPRWRPGPAPGAANDHSVPAASVRTAAPARRTRCAENRASRLPIWARPVGRSRSRRPPTDQRGLARLPPVHFPGARCEPPGRR